jgi:hypothetical protein
MRTSKQTINPTWHIVPVLNGWRAWSTAGEPGLPAHHDCQVVVAEVARRNGGVPITEADAWAKCPAPGACRRSGMDRPCLACWGAAGDILAGLRK